MKQNQPPEMKKFMLFDEGYIGYNIDLSQAENRIVAYVGPVPEMIETFEAGVDVHSKTASMICGLPIDEIKRQDKEQIYSPLGGGMFTWRGWGKRANHGLNYDFGYRSFSLLYEIPENDAYFLVEKYHTVYPGVRQGFHAQVKAMLSRDRTVTNCMGRKRLMLDRWGDHLFKEAYAQIPQSTVADVMNERGIHFLYYTEDPLFKPVEILLQVHDSLVFQIPKEVPLTQHAEILLAIKKSLETPLRWQSREFVIPIDLEISIGNMGKYSPINKTGLKGIDRVNLTNVEVLTSALQDTLTMLNG